LSFNQMLYAALDARLDFWDCLELLEAKRLQ
jgi:hypothetical protein